jgi:hypothetical protein
MFDVKKHLIKVQGGRQYLPVAARLIGFRAEHPDWGIDTRPIALDVEKQYAVFEASVYNAEGKLMAKGTKLENIRGFGDWLEKAETGAIGRALAVCGYGTQFAPDLEESHTDNDNRYISTQHSNNSAGYSRHYASSPVSVSGEPNVSDSNFSNGQSGIKSTSLALSDSSGSPTNNETCEVCSAVLRPNQLALSLRKFQTALCPDCQKKRQSENAA